MNRRAFVTGLGAVLAAPLAATAQQPVKPLVRVGSLENATGPSQTWDSFVKGLRDRGWIDGQNLVFERRYAEGRPERFPVLAEELVDKKVDVIVSSYTPGVHAAKRATSTIPIVMAGAGDPTGLVGSLARPDGNVTGVTALTLELGPKQLQLLKELVPAAARAAYVVQSTLVHRERLWDEMANGARMLGVELIGVMVDSPERLLQDLNAMLGQRPDGLIVHGGPLIVRHGADITAFAAKHNLPAIYDNSFFVTRGGLVSYGASFTALTARAAIYVDKILRGAKPADLPVEQPTTFELVINLKTAKALGLTMPPSLLLRADQVIEQ